MLLSTGATVAQSGDDEDADVPDLVVEEIEWAPEDPEDGDAVTVSAQVVNEGEANASAFNVSFEIDGELHDTVEVDELPADGQRQVTSEPWNASEGLHNVSVVGDADDAVAESDEENNAETEELEVEAAEEPETEDEDETDEEEADDEDADEEPPSSWDVDNGTYTGDHIQVTVDEELPGLTDVNYLDPNASVFASVALDGSNFTHEAAMDVLSGETDAAELLVRDEDGGHLTVEIEEDNASVTLQLADGVAVEESDRFADDDEDEAVYELNLTGNETAWLFGEELAFDNGTFTVNDEAHLSRTFPPGDAEADEDAEEDDERPEERREAGSQWDRSNASFEGENVLFELGDDNASIEDYAIRGSIVPVFAEVGLSTNDTEWAAHGKAFELKADDSRLRVIDVPPAVLLVRAGDEGPAQLTLADGVEAERLDLDDEDEEENETEDDDERVYELSLAQNRTGWLMGEEISFDNGTFTVNDRATFRAMPDRPDASENRGPGSMPDEAREREDEEDDELESEEARGPPSHARAHPLDDDARRSVEEAIAKGQVAAELHVGENDTEPVAVEMGDVQVRKAWAEDRGEVRAGMQVGAPDGTPGTTVNMKLDASRLGDVSIEDAGERLDVRYDNASIEMADDLDDVLNPDDDNGSAEYLLLVGSDEVEILVSVPGFSVHEIEVTSASTQSAEDAGNGAPGPGVLAVAAAIGLTATALRTRKEN